MTLQNLIDADHPWPGLLPFTEDAKAFFFGRETETNELTRLIEREPLTVLFGQSGLGKSSLLNAGVFPKLRRAGYLPLYLRLNLDTNAPALIDQVWQTLKDECARHDVTATEAKAGDSFWKYLHRPGTHLQNPHGREVTPVLAFDQFEELFTLGRQTAQQNARCQTFLRELGELIENRLPPSLEAELTTHPEALDDFDLLRQNLKIVFAFREDYLAEFEGLKTLIRPIMQNRMRLTPMTGSRAAQAIKQAGADKVSETVAARIVRFVGGAGRDETTPLDQVQVEPALLSLVCRELNEQRLKRGEREISADLIQGDNTQQIIEQFYRQGFQGVDAKVKHFVEDRLLTTAGYRDSCALDNALAEPGISEAALQTLVDKRILRREERGGLVRLELIHDVLAGVAKTSRDQRRAEAALAEAKRQIAEQKKRQRLFAMAAAVLLAVFAGISWLAVDASRARRLAEEQRLAADGERLSAINAKKDADSARESADGQRLRAEAASARALNEEKNAVDQKLAAETALQRAQLAEKRALQEKNAAEVSKEQGERTLGLALAEKAERAFADGRANDGQIFAAHALVRLARQANANDAGVMARLRGSRLSFPGVSIVNFAGHEGAISAAVISRDGRMLATASLDRTVRLWDTEKKTNTAVLVGHEAAPTSLAFSPDGRTLVSTSSDRTVRTWNVADGQPGHVFSGHEQVVMGALFSPDGQTIASWSQDGTARLWNVESGSARHVLKGHEGYISGVSFSQDGRRLVSWSAQRDTGPRLWDVASGKLIETLSGHEERVSHAAFSSDGRMIVTASSDKAARLWDGGDGKLIGTLREPLMTQVTHAAFSPDGLRVATASLDSMVRLWDVKTQKGTVLLQGHAQSVYHVEFSADGSTLTSISVGTGERVVRRWSVASGKALETFAPVETETNFNALLLSGGRMAVTESREGNVARLWKLEASPTVFSQWVVPIVAVAFFQGRRADVLGITPDENGRIWDAEGGKSSVTFSGLRGLTVAEFSGDGRMLATGAQDKSVRFWDGTTGKLRSTLTAHLDTVADVRFSPDGRTLASSSIDKTVRLWDVASAALIATLEGHKMAVSRVAFSPDGSLLASASADKTVRLWSTQTKTYLGSFVGHSDAVQSVAFSSDGSILASASSDNTVRLWSVADRTLRQTLRGHTLPVMDIAFLPDGGTVLTGAADKSVRMWNVQTGKIIKVFAVEAPIRRLAVSSDGQIIAAASFNGSVRQWRDFSREDAITDWRAQAAKDEARYGLKLEGIALVPK